MSIPPVLTEAVSSRNRAAKSEKQKRISASSVLAILEQHILLDGFKVVIDLEKSRGSYLYDAATGHQLIDLYGFFGSMPVGFNHPYFERDEVKSDLLRAAKVKVANSDVYSQGYARFVETFSRVAGLPPLECYLFIEGGALAVENCLKAAMDWKVRKNMTAGRGERGTQILHFRRAFHGRTGYTMSLTNTDPRKTDLFAKFDWPRVSCPCIDFSLPEAEREADVIAREKKAETEIRDTLDHRKIDICAIIIEPIQGEGGDNHFRGEWLKKLRKICDENEILLIFDEVQCGMGATGRNWCCEHFDVVPDLLAFGKKAQVCGVMAGPRLDEVKDNAFRLPSRLNSTWGGNFTDMVRSTHFLRIVEEEHLVENAAKVGGYFLGQLRELQNEFDFIKAVRGRGMFLAFDLPDAKAREDMWKGLFDLGVLTLRSGEDSIRFRPTLDMTAEVVDEAIELMRKYCRQRRK
ncbi:MAG: L-lysine 6-transaminase [Verrucomicrobia bacterium]|nr:MAG: L-lysine 6-transaminase [Verrucomicrobiota bacterium]PYK93662.1 MAG: L-lysine 6-transaminase [Verrucomicrobiota bacterium]